MLYANNAVAEYAISVDRLRTEHTKFKTCEISLHNISKVVRTYCDGGKIDSKVW